MTIPHGGISKGGPSAFDVSFGMQNINTNAKGIGIGIGYATWRAFRKWIPSTCTLDVEHQSEIPILCVLDWKLTMSHGGTSKTGSPAHPISMWDTKSVIAILCVYG